MQTELFHLKILNQEFDLRASRNSNYSLRAFARDLGLSPALLSQVMSGKRGLSSKMAHSISSKLKLPSAEADFLICSVEAAFSRSKALRNEAAVKLARLKMQAKSVRQYRREEMSTANKWHHFAILEILERQDFKPDPLWISRQLGIHTHVVKKSLEQLEKLGWIRRQGQSWVATHNQSETSFDIPCGALRELHFQFLELAKKALYEGKVEDREFLNMTLAFPSQRTHEAKEAIRQFQKKFADQFYSPSATKDSIYQFSIQLFRLDNKG